MYLHFHEIMYGIFYFRSDAQRAAKQKEAKERELEHAAFSADRIEEGGFPPVSMVRLKYIPTDSTKINHPTECYIDTKRCI